MRRNFDKIKETCNAQADSINGRVDLKAWKFASTLFVLKIFQQGTIKCMKLHPTANFFEVKNTFNWR